ncbi:hypothetical protein C2845_PM05G32970 [Panicum miliaceum]|uniref:Uncharacterized protein n=1 Tax=Panicum miliaceum TaxID=4540 RepID=A0A3L6STL7_PANMI|nr:hypothetical protein C2845_PM05G32970 [Panicum miliaceum]
MILCSKIATLANDELTGHLCCRPAAAGSLHPSVRPASCCVWPAPRPRVTVCWVPLVGRALAGAEPAARPAAGPGHQLRGSGCCELGCRLTLGGLLASACCPAVADPSARAQVAAAAAGFCLCGPPPPQHARRKHAEPGCSTAPPRPSRALLSPNLPAHREKEKEGKGQEQRTKTLELQAQISRSKLHESKRNFGHGCATTGPSRS